MINFATKARRAEVSVIGHGYGRFTDYAVMKQCS
jgi:hypothetical protein